MKGKEESIIADCINFTDQRDYISYDVFDAMNSNFLSKITGNNVFLKRVAIQLNAKSLMNLRPLLGVKKMVHTKTLSDFLSIYSHLYSITRDENYKIKAHEIYNQLWERRIKIDNGFGWGLNFHYSTRFTNASKSTPNLYNTLNASHSIIDFYEVFNSIELKDFLDGVLDFILNYLGVVEETETISWLRYYPKQTGMPTPNVNATSASLFVRINSIYANKIDHSLIVKLLNFVKVNQNKDGSWYYTTNEKGRWIDGFHTGFVLESLALIKKLDSKYDVDKCLDLGVDYFIKNLISEDFIPKYFDNKTYPIESQNCAQCIQTLSKLIMYNNYNLNDLLEKVIKVVLDNLYDKEGYFYHKKTKISTYKHYYGRWSQSPMILSLIYALKTK
jgi:hypothetical protein